MAAVTRKREIRVVDGTPEKRTFLSIISDYNLRTGLCELIDNALDLWIAKNSSRPPHIDITLDVDRQLISVTDDAGGVPENDLRLLVAPGASGNALDQEIIGIFGVGSKRAGVALGELVEIRTRYKKEKSLQIDVTNEWIKSDDWDIAVYEIPDIAPGTTTVAISKLRQTFDASEVEEIRAHLGETYAWFIRKGCTITLNKKPIKAIRFDHWAYPPGFEPRIAKFEITPADGKSLAVTITAGLIRDRDPEAENYGVYAYCNHRLIVKELQTRDVGYVSGEAGVPHPDASLCRVILELQGAVELMPWNSSKNRLNITHPAFLQVRSTLIRLTSYFSTLSRRLKTDWDGQVFPYASGKIEEIDPEDIAENRKIVLPELPRVRKPPRLEQLKALNAKILDDKPWTLGLVEAMGLVEIVTKQKLDTKNRAALILLDSNFEIALKEFIVNRTDLFPHNHYRDSRILQIFASRNTVISEVTAHVPIPAALLTKVNHYYNLRNKLIHERATVGITDAQIEDYRRTIEKVLKLLFGLRFSRS